MENKVKSKALEKLIKETFCMSENKTKIVNCPYISKKFCPKTCSYAIKVYTEKVKYWLR